MSMWAVLDPLALLATIDTEYGQGIGSRHSKVWFSGSWRADVSPSPKVQAQVFGPPPDVSRNSTVNGEMSDSTG